jgi:hypothetical protein
MRLSKMRGAALLLFLCLWFACRPDKTAEIHKKAQQRIEDFRKKHELELRTGLLTRASAIADSILLAEAQAQVRDSLSRTKPFRPLQPPPIPPIDSLAVKPIF